MATLAVLSLLAFGSQPLPSSSHILCDQAALQRALHDARRHYNTVGTPGSMTSVEMPGQQNYGAMTRAAIQAGDIYIACGRPVEALQQYGYASQYVLRYDPNDRKGLDVKYDHAARLVLRNPHASEFDKRAARWGLCMHWARSSAAIYRCDRQN